MSKRNTLEYIIDKANKIHNNAYDYSNLKDHKSMHDVVEIICPKHGVFKKSMHSHTHKKRGCKQCAIDRVTDTKEKFIDKANKIHDNFYNYDKADYLKSKIKIIITCPIHGDFTQRPMDHLNSKQGCPICKESKGEKEVRIVLKEFNIDFVPQKTFCDLRHKNCLSFDFYLPDYNTCVEYDGPQHFDSYDIFGGEEAFKLIQMKDEMKRAYCEKNGIKLLRITYKDKKSIENIIKDFLSIKENKILSFGQFRSF